jgi:hypothetical protein
MVLELRELELEQLSVRQELVQLAEVLEPFVCKEKKIFVISLLTLSDSSR